MDNILNNLGQTLIDHGKDILDDPSKLFSFVGQEVLDQLIDKAMAEVKTALTSPYPSPWTR